MTSRLKLEFGDAANNEDQGYMIPRKEGDVAMEMKDSLTTDTIFFEKDSSTHELKRENKNIKIDTSSASAFIASVRRLDDNVLTKESSEEESYEEMEEEVVADSMKYIMDNAANRQKSDTYRPAQKDSSLVPTSFISPEDTAIPLINRELSEKKFREESSATTVMNHTTYAAAMQIIENGKSTASKVNETDKNLNSDIFSSVNFEVNNLVHALRDNMEDNNWLNKDQCEIEASISWPSEKDVISVIEKLHLSVYWKQKLSTEKVKEFSMCRPSGVKGSTETVFKFFHKLLHNSVDARNEIMFEKSNMEYNSMDLIYCFLLIADDFLRQEICSRLAVLQYSVPFCIKDPSRRYLLLNWSLLNISKRWKTSNDKSYIETDVHSGSFVYCSFIKIGDLPFSKSKLINKLFPKGNEPFQNYEEDDVPRCFSSGSLELSWLLPVRDENFEPLAIVNMRGNAEMNMDLALYVAKQSSILCVIVGNSSAKTKSILLALAKYRSNIIVISDKKVNADDMIKRLPTMKKCEYIRDTEPRIVQKLKPLVLNKSLKKRNFSDWEETATALKFLLEDSDKHMQAGRRSAEILAKEIVKHKLSSLPLSGSLWKDYNDIHKKQKRITDKPTEISVKKYIVVLEEDKKIIRTRQATFLPSKFFEFFAQQLILYHKEREYFLFWLSQYLERFSRNLTGGVDIGLEHLMRELSQMYVLHALNESLSEKSSLATILKINNENAELYVKHAMIDILFAGHPIELFDGDAQGIPDIFFADLMQGLQDRMGKRNRIGVISVLGVQSSGKSTLLNAMFGCKFIVSSGRCTKGVNMQLVTIQKQYAAKFNVDYILVLDTEGLKSPERQDLLGNNEHDSELATFVVGLSDVVVLNVASESMDALKDIIQITIHAFLRMKDVTYQKTKCLFIHQNTGDPSNYQKLANERKLFEKTLKDLTEIAAKSEIGTTEVSFKDILDYDEDMSHEYFPCLYDGTLPMAAINQGYAEKVISVKEYILLSLSKNQSQTPSSFCKKVFQIWDAVLAEDFLYSFKNSLIAFKREALDDKFAELEWEFRQELKKHLEGFQTEISNSIEIPSLRLNTQRLEDIFEDIPDRMLQKIEDYLKDDPISKRLFFEEVKSSVAHLMMKTKTELLESLSDFAERERNKREIASKEVGLETFFQEKITSLVEQCKSQGKCLGEEEATIEFDKLWAHLLNELKDHSFKRIEETDFERIVREYLLQKYSKKRKKCLKSELEHKEFLTDFGLEDIDISPLCEQSSYLCKLKKLVGFRSNEQDAAANHRETNKRLIGDLINHFESETERALGTKEIHFEDWKCIMGDLLRGINSNLSNYMYKPISENMVIRTRITLCIFGNFVRALENFRGNYLENNDPVRKIDRRKNYFKKSFLALCVSRSLASTAAGKFIEECYIPGIIETIEISIDRVLATEFKNKNPEFTNRKACEVALLRETQETGDFHTYLKLIHQYRKHLDDWLHFKMTSYFNKPCLCDPCQRSKRKRFCHVIFERTDNINQSIWTVLDNILSDSKSDISVAEVLSKISTSSKQSMILKMEIMAPFLNLACGYEFAEILAKELERFNADRFSEKEKWINCAVQYLIESLIGCGNCCPFCGAPCSLSSSQHDEHSTKFHRPQVIVGYSFESSNDAMIENCPAYVAKGTSFQNQDTRWQFVSYRDYKTIYPHWNIQPNLALESGIFWKWVLVNRACEFELYYGFNPHSIPEGWRDITWESVEREFESQLQTPGDEEHSE